MSHHKTLRSGGGSRKEVTTSNLLSGRVDRASTIEMANSGSIPGRVISTHASTLYGRQG